MPEAPEVRIMSQNMSYFLLNQRLLQLDIVNEAFRKKCRGLDKLQLPAKVVEVNSRGKFAYIIFDDGTAIGIGFGMTGNIRSPSLDLKHAMLKFVSDKNTEDNVFYYCDPRRFGNVYYLTEKEFKHKLNELGPSILDDVPLDKGKLLSRWRCKNKDNICKLLMNQSPISGIGNYIKAEILYRCHIHPLATVSSLSDADLYDLYLAAREIASDAVRAGGASLYTYTGMEGDRSVFKEELLVYNRAKDPLGLQVITTQTPDDRTTYWVPSIQTVGAPATAPTTATAPAIATAPAPIKIKIRAKTSIA